MPNKNSNPSQEQSKLEKELIAALSENLFPEKMTDGYNSSLKSIEEKQKDI